MSNEQLSQLNRIQELYNPSFIPRDQMMDIFNSLSGPSVYQVLPIPVMDYLTSFIFDPKNNKTVDKINHLDRVLSDYGFKRFAAGTNRVVYRFMEDTSFCLKVAFSKSAAHNNPDEFKNQQFLKPFVSKVFSVSNDGVFATCERVTPIRNREEFVINASDIFDVIANRFIGKYLLEDIGTEYFKNWGIRQGFGPVLLDYPYIYEIDINNLYCNSTDTGIPCGGPIDYDDGFNYLYCMKCGKRHAAKHIGKAIENNIIIKTIKGEIIPMKATITLDGRTFTTEDRPAVDRAINPEVVKNKPTRRPSRFKSYIVLNGDKYGITESGEYVQLNYNPKNKKIPQMGKLYAKAGKINSPESISYSGKNDNTDIDQFVKGISDTGTFEVVAKIAEECNFVTESPVNSNPVDEKATKAAYTSNSEGITSEAAKSAASLIVTNTVQDNKTDEEEHQSTETSMVIPVSKTDQIEESESDEEYSEDEDESFDDDNVSEENTDTPASESDDNLMSHEDIMAENKEAYDKEYRDELKSYGINPDDIDRKSEKDETSSTDDEEFEGDRIDNRKKKMQNRNKYRYTGKSDMSNF